MAATVEVGAESWFVDEGDCVIAECYTEERAHRVCAALNEVATLRAQVERVRALAPRWMAEQSEYPGDERARYAAAALRVCARELLAALDESDTKREA